MLEPLFLDLSMFLPFFVTFSEYHYSSPSLQNSSDGVHGFQIENPNEDHVSTEFKTDLETGLCLLTD